MKKPLIQLDGVTKTYGEGENAVTALTSASLALFPGEVVLIEGPSGSGKTTLLSILGLLLKPTAGRILLEGREISRLTEGALPRIRAERFGFIFQGFNLFPALNALENVALAIRMKDEKTRHAEDEGRRLLELVGLGARAHHLPSDSSGGQKQRVAIARALGGNPQIILGDEPTAALDSKTGLAIMELLRSLATEQGRSVVVVTHDHRLERFADRVVRVEDGLVLSRDDQPRALAI